MFICELIEASPRIRKAAGDERIVIPRGSRSDPRLRRVGISASWVNFVDEYPVSVCRVFD